MISTKISGSFFEEFNWLRMPQTKKRLYKYQEDNNNWIRKSKLKKYIFKTLFEKFLKSGKYPWNQSYSNLLWNCCRNFWWILEDLWNTLLLLRRSWRFSRWISRMIIEKIINCISRWNPAVFFEGIPWKTSNKILEETNVETIVVVFAGVEPRMTFWSTYEDFTW